MDETIEPMDARIGAEEWMDNDDEDEGQETCCCQECDCDNPVWDFGDICDACHSEHLEFPL